MHFSDYCKDRIELFLLFGSELLLLSLFLCVTGYGGAKLLLIIIAQLAGVIGATVIGYVRRKRYFDELDQILDQLDQRYLIAEVMHDSYRYEDRKYRDILRRSNKSVIEKIHGVEQEQKDYKEYIEGWIHEVKTPLTTMNLICANHKDETTRKMLTEIAKVDNYVEMALFYARADHVYQDYIINETDLYEIITAVLQKNRESLILHKIAISLEFEHSTILTDQKWVEFIINQIVINSIKYSKEQNKNFTPSITFTIEPAPNKLSLVICDNGIGIPQHELMRVFEKGFTGSNGRNIRKKAGNQEYNHQLDKISATIPQATGIGLYLCKQLCDQLGIGIEAVSEEGKFTKLILTFPQASLTRAVFQNCKIHES